MVKAHDTSLEKRTSDVKITHNVTFDTMLLKEPTLHGLKSASFFKPSPIQLHGIPLGKCGFDLLLEAKSGTGKTAVFTVVALEKLDLDKGLQAVILAPTREIAAQICDVIREIGVGFSGLSVEVVMGGLSVQDDIAKFKVPGKQVHILVGSPGRLRHLIQDKHVDTSSVRLLILDEADKLVESSFQADINYIFSVLPKQKQVILSSATYPEKSKEFIKKYVENLQHVCPDSTSVLMGISQMVTTISFNSNIVKQTKLRYEELLKVLTKKQFKQCLIFCNYQARVTELHKLLTSDKWPSEQLYGLQQQTDRLDALRTLQDYKCRILISTDLAARGIDAFNVDMVVNFEPPYEWQTYLHRIGRAGRYGSYGIAVTILSQGKEELKFKEMLTGMKDTINLNYLWSGSKYEIVTKKNEDFQQVLTNKNNIEKILSETAAPSIIKNYNTKIFKEIWKEMSSFTECSSDVITFEDLNGSFEKPNIESFSNLLDSFETDEVQEDASLDYNCINIKFNTMDIQDCLKYITDEQTIKSIEHNHISSQNKNCQVLNSSSKLNIDNVDHINGTKYNKKASNIRIQNESTKKKDRSIDRKTSYEKREEPQIFNNFNKTHYKHNVDDKEEILHDEESEMIRLGLPTSFWSKLDLKKQIKTKNKSEKNKAAKPNGRNLAAKEINNNHTLLLQGKMKYQNADEKDNTTNLDSYSNPIIPPPLIKNRHTYFKRPYKDTKNTLFESISTYLDVDSVSKDARKQTGNLFKSKRKIISPAVVHYTGADYVQWYTQLKLRTQQIEMALYLETLAKL